MTNGLTRLSGVPLVMAGLLLAAGTIPSGAQAERPRRFSEAQLFFELNDTDGDLGIHAAIDGGPWTDLEIEGPGDRLLLNIISRGRLRTQGLTQLGFESAEPPFDELAPADFFRRFPEGRYEIEARAQDGATIEGRAILSHVLAAPPANILLSGVPAADSCDAEPLPVITSPVLIEWEPVTRSHPDIGQRGTIGVRRYQLFIEGDGVKLSLDLPPSVTEFEVPEAVTDTSEQLKFEIIVQTSTGNNTAVESCFRMF